ncbi:putative ADP-ribosylation factor GTPase-activating protein GCS1 [Calycina marina]|uniref:ADP-ribosylation factor GTPase-activating protein GCS1 n=1 Tax=Calycina marina TaxID=1763456 RepID=A0A9P7Z2S2_9HELO|nr:putative ADP-ribosylation factor GTPase-activating protein GCS1 [Calycina marina]
MASKAMWEVDPETRSKLLEIQQKNNNERCADCSAPSPQWASPKFGVFICLSCAGVHRGLGVHISFVRSITMDAFKSREIEQMRLGGNKPWRDFFDDAEANKMMGVTWDDATIAERYSGDVGEEYKDRLAAKVECREYVPGEKKEKTANNFSGASLSSAGSRSGTPVSGRLDSPSRVPGVKSKVDDRYFAGLGAANASRSAALPPSQGGKYSGFGSSPSPSPMEPPRSATLPGLDDLQKDPLQALSKGFGWFTSTVGKTAKTVNEGYIQPTAAKLAETDLAAQARQTAAQVARGAQAGAKGATDGFNRFVEGTEGGVAKRTVPLDESKKDFWDSFADAGQQKQQQAAARGSLGTASIKKPATPMGPGAKEEDKWDAW